MDPTQTAQLLAENFPGLAAALHSPATRASVYKQLDCFAAFTRAAAAADERPLVGQCFAVADGLWQRGDAGLAAAVENVYLYGLHLDGNARNRQLVRQLMPAGLHGAYAHQHATMLP